MALVRFPPYTTPQGAYDYFLAGLLATIALALVLFIYAGYIP
jgi:hypothetical protein